MTFHQQAEYYILRSLEPLVKRLPAEAASALGTAIGRLLFAMRFRRSVAVENMRWILGRYDRGLLRDSCAFLGRAAIDLLRLPHPPLRRVRLEGFGHLQKAMAAGRGVVLLTAHIGNWELLAPSLAARGVPTDLVVREQENPATSALISSQRRRTGARTMHVGKMEMRTALRGLREGRCLVIFGDIDPRRGGTSAPFFGRSVRTADGAFHLAVRASAPVLPVFLLETKPGGYRQVFHPPLTQLHLDGRPTIIGTCISEFNVLLEKQILDQPSQWFWLHRRWKG